MAAKNEVFMLAVLLFVSILSTFIHAQDIAKPGCQQKCGNVSIIYPFGIGKGCYLNADFEIACKFLQPFLVKSSMRVNEITPEYIYVEHLNISTCYSDKENKKVSTYNLWPFTLLSNKLTAIGCNIYAYVTDLDSVNPTSGCISLCEGGNNYNINGSCSGSGCCQTNIPNSFGGLANFEVGIISVNINGSGNSMGGNCSTAIIAEDLKVTGSNNFMVTSQNYSQLSILQWWIYRASFSNTICSSSSYITDYGDNHHYQCNCQPQINSGVESGSPYLPNGCLPQGSKQCGDSSISCGKEDVCTFAEGNWSCIKKKNSEISPGVIASIALGGALLLLIILALAYWLCGALKKSRERKLKKKFFRQNGGLLLEQQNSSGESNMEKTKVFLTEELEKATDNFNENRILGKGGSGTVYKGMLPDGKIVAIKKSKVVDQTQIGQFINEIVILSEINHKNIVKVMGCCLETEVPLLVYEYVSRGTLSEHLHGENQLASISWEERLRIAREIAGALAYLHSSLSTPIFHRDIKSCNILLDENFKAKVSDFGISRSVPHEQTHLSTVVQGTFGYLDPEYFHSGQFTDKSDVYGFGVVLVELLTGQKAVSARSEDEKNLAMHFLSSVKEDRVLQLLEERVVNEARKEEIQVVATLAKKCLKIVGKKRPTMKEVLLQLENLGAFLRQGSVVSPKWK